MSELTGLTFFGIYQIYGAHPIYGTPHLLYIGKADKRNFGTRIPEHSWVNGTRDPSQISVYIGRLCGYTRPDDEAWSREIDYAERLLIYAHFPPYNTQKWTLCTIPALKGVHVYNWGAHRDLLPEVSGGRYIDVEDCNDGYGPYDTLPLAKNPLDGVAEDKNDSNQKM